MAASRSQSKHWFVEKKKKKTKTRKTRADCCTQFKQKTATLKVSSTITLDSLLNKLAEAFGGIRVKIRIVDDDEEQIAIGNDIELANVLAGEDQVEFQCSKVSE